MTRYYDLVLGLIPLALVGITAGLVAAGFALTTAIPIAGFVSIALIGHAMFVRTPRAPSQRTPDAGFNSAD